MSWFADFKEFSVFTVLCLAVALVGGVLALVKRDKMKPIMIVTGVLEVAAIGVPSGSSGEAVKIFVVKKDAALTEEALITFCRRHLTGYKVPKLVEFRDELPKSNVGKILRRELRDEARAKVDNKG